MWEKNIPFTLHITYGTRKALLNANKSLNMKKIHPFFQDFKIPKQTSSLALKSGYFFPTQEMPKIEEVIIGNKIDLPYLSGEKVIGYFNTDTDNKKSFGLILDDI